MTRDDIEALGDREVLEHLFSAGAERLIFRRKDGWEENITKIRSKCCDATILTKLRKHKIKDKWIKVRICKECEKVVGE